MPLTGKLHERERTITLQIGTPNDPTGYTVYPIDNPRIYDYTGASFCAFRVVDKADKMNHQSRNVLQDQGHALLALGRTIPKTQQAAEPAGGKSIPRLAHDRVLGRDPADGKEGREERGGRRPRRLEGVRTKPECALKSIE